MSEYKLGDSVKVKDGVKDPDFGISIGGWQGRIIDIDAADNTIIEIEWDSITLRSMPEEIVTSCFADGISIASMFMSIDEIELAKPRDKKTDIPNTLQEIYARHGREYKTELETLMESLFILDDLKDDDWDEEETTNAFDLTEFFKLLKIDNEREQQFIVQCFGKGLEVYYNHIYGYDKYGKNPVFLIEDRMFEPYIFGFGMVEVMRNKKISWTTKVQVANYTLQTINPEAEYGIPHGLVVLASYMAVEGNLPEDTFRGIMQITQADRYWADGWKVEEITSLSDWLITNEKFSDEEKLWWLWYFSSAFSYNAHTGKKAVNHWLTHKQLVDEIKRELCWAWLTNNKQPGTPPPAWRLAEAQYQGDSEKAAQAMRELGASEKEIAEIQKELDMARQQDPWGMLFATDSPMFIDPVMTFIHMPNWVKRLSIPTLIRLGEDAPEVCATFLDAERDYGSETVNQGIADAILAFQDQFTVDEVRVLIEKGIQIPQVSTRKTFFTLSTEFFGNEYLLKTQEDNAASVRQWGAKQLKKFE